MRIHLHDFSGHPFQAQLSRAIAARGHEVVHSFSAQYASGKGLLTRVPGDSSTLTFELIDAGVPFDKYSPRRRLRFELAHARALGAEIERTRPDVVVACNVPLLALSRFAKLARRSRQPWVLWHQDIFSSAMTTELERSLPKPIAALASAMLTRIERRAVTSAQSVVAIGDEFAKVYDQWGVDRGRVRIIPNWAPIDEIRPVARDNAWARRHLDGTDGALRLLYAGTLGRKHNPMLLVELLNRARAAGIPAQLSVISQGEGADEVARALADSTHPHVELGFQPAEEIKDVLGSADVLVALLEPDASRYSIPSKVLSYLAAGRPIVGLMPADNPAALDIAKAQGFVATPDARGVDEIVSWLRRLWQDRARIVEVGSASRALAEQRFNIRTITDQFESVLRASLTVPGRIEERVESPLNHAA